MALLLCLFLIACGGGGGSDAPSGGGNGGNGNGGGNGDGGDSGEPAILPSENWLCFKADQNNCSIKTSVIGSLAVTPSLEYSKDKEIWTPFIIASTIVDLPNTDDKVYIRATSSNASFSGAGGYIRFVITGFVSASGNIMSLLDKNCGGNSVPERAFRQLFYNNSTLTTAPKLPATILGSYCYSSMFNGCSSLTTAPDLPATTLADYCYFHMFKDCSSLTAVPTELPAINLATRCYEGMFKDCSAMATAPDLPATTLAEACYISMFDGCSALTTAPALPATTLANSCYAFMFSDCSSLSSITVNFTTWDNAYTADWVSWVPSDGTFTCPAGLLEEYGDSRIPSGWDVQHPTP